MPAGKTILHCTMMPAGPAEDHTKRIMSYLFRNDFRGSLSGFLVGLLRGGPVSAGSRRTKLPVLAYGIHPAIGGAELSSSVPRPPRIWEAQRSAITGV